MNHREVGESQADIGLETLSFVNAEELQIMTNGAALIERTPPSTKTRKLKNAASSPTSTSKSSKAIFTTPKQKTKNVSHNKTPTISPSKSTTPKPKPTTSSTSKIGEKSVMKTTDRHRFYSSVYHKARNHFGKTEDDTNRLNGIARAAARIACEHKFG